jgi:nucleoside-diphosphate-sugar epimerase
MTETNTSLAVIGCGWLGLPLAEMALSAGHIVKGSTTTRAKIDILKLAGIEPYLVDLRDGKIEDSSIFDVDYVILNIPPGRRNPRVMHDYPAAIDLIFRKLQSIQRVRKVIFISSTSVYGDDYDFIDENTTPLPSSDSGKALLSAEEIVRRAGISYAILRFGGLAGPDRHPGKFLAGKTSLPSGEQSVNFLHRDDAVGAILSVTNEKEKREVYNVVSPIHPTKKEFYAKMSEMIGLMPPVFTGSPGIYRREISVQKFIDETKYHFKYPDPMNFRF